MSFEIEPYVSAGPLKFGMTRKSVRRLLGGKVTTFKQPRDEEPVDAFDGRGIQAYYRSPGVLEAIEFGDAATPTYLGRTLLGRPYEELKTWFQSLDPGVEEDDAGLTSYKLGIGLYAPQAEKAPENPVEGVIAFERGYYDS